MTLPRAGSAGLLLAALVLTPLVARAAGGISGLFSGLNYSVGGGGMFPVAPQGDPLRRGPTFGGTIYGETGLGFMFGVDGSYTSSGDDLGTKITMLGAVARLSPMPDYQMYVQVGAAAYHVSYDPDAPTLTAPESTTRPGGSFGIGFDFFDVRNAVLGVSFGYHGIVLGRSDALSFMIATVNLTLKSWAY